MDNTVNKYIALGWWSIVMIVLFFYMQTNYSYHFYFMEQNFMFQYSWSYIGERLVLPGGFVKVISEYLIQFFMYPYAGAGIMTFILLLMSLLTWFVLKKVRSDFNGLYISLFPAICFIIIFFDFNYKLEGTIAYLLMLAFLLVSFSIMKDSRRFIFNLFSVACLFWLGGAITVLYVLLIVIFEFLKETPLRYYSVLFIAEAMFLGVLSLYMALLGEYRFVFLPDAYYHAPLQPDYYIYLSWIVLPVLFVSTLLGNKNRSEGMKLYVLKTVLQIGLIAGFSWWGIKAYQSEKWQIMSKLDYFARTEQWDALLRECDTPMKNYLHLNYMNMALAEKGDLADKMFFYDQNGTEGLLFTWSKVFIVSTLLSDVYFTIGNIALSQEMAFEAYVSAVGDGSPRMLKRLVQTNLIYGEYAVAEKYIDLLEKTAYYSDWATRHRVFLYNDKAVGADPLLGVKRRGLVEHNYLSKTKGLHQDFVVIAEQNSDNKVAIEYVGGLYLLSKDLKEFEGLLDEYYETDVLPVLPLSFQEAVLLMLEGRNPEEMKRFDINEPVVNRFNEYRKMVISNKNNPSLSQIMKSNYGNTYWFYYMFK